MIDNKPNSPSGFTWAVMPPDPGLEAEMLTRLMIKFGTPAPEATASVQAAVSPARAERARLENCPTARVSSIVDDNFDRAWRRVGLALDRVGFTVVDRDRSKGTYFVRYSNPDVTGRRRTKGFLDKLMFWKDDVEKPEQYRITVAQADPRSLVTVQDPNGAPDKSANGEKILASAQRSAQVAARRTCASRHSAAAARATVSSSNAAVRGSSSIAGSASATPRRASRVSASAVVADRDPRHARAYRSCRRRARVRREAWHSGLGDLRHARGRYRRVSKG